MLGDVTLHTHTHTSSGAFIIKVSETLSGNTISRVVPHPPTTHTFLSLLTLGLWWHIYALKSFKFLSWLHCELFNPISPGCSLCTACFQWQGYYLSPWFRLTGYKLCKTLDSWNKNSGPPRHFIKLITRMNHNVIPRLIPAVSLVQQQVSSARKAQTGKDGDW